MTTRLTCPRCKTQFAAPAHLTSALVGCPVCNAVLNMPVTQPDPNSQPAFRNEFWERSADWWIVAAVLLVSFLGLMADVLFLRTVYVTFISLAGAILGGLAWRTQLLERKREGDKWRWLENNLGVIVAYAGLGLCCIHFIFFVYCLILFVKDVGWHESIPPLLGALMLFLALNVGIAIGLHSLFERFGFYRAMSCIYVVVAGVLPFLAVLVGNSLGAQLPRIEARMFNPQTLLDPAEHELALRTLEEASAPSRRRSVPQRPQSDVNLLLEPTLPSIVDFNFGSNDPPANPANIPAPAQPVVPAPEPPAPAVAANGPPLAAPVEPAQPAPPVQALASPIPAPSPAAATVNIKPAEPPLRTNKPHILTVVGGRRIIVPSGKLLAPETQLTPGTEVQAEFNNQWNIGRVVEVLPDGDVNLIWLDGAKDAPEVVPRHRIRLDLAKDEPQKAEAPLEIAKTNRRWIDVQGNVIVARFIFCDGLVLRLRTTEGKVITVPFEGLSISDQEVVREIVTAKMDEKAHSQP